MSQGLLPGFPVCVPKEQGLPTDVAGHAFRPGTHPCKRHTHLHSIAGTFVRDPGKRCHWICFQVSPCVSPRSGSTPPMSQAMPSDRARIQTSTLARHGLNACSRPRPAMSQGLLPGFSVCPPKEQGHPTDDAGRAFRLCTHPCKRHTRLNSIAGTSVRDAGKRCHWVCFQVSLCAPPRSRASPPMSQATPSDHVFKVAGRQRCHWVCF